MKILIILLVTYRSGKKINTGRNDQHFYHTFLESYIKQEQNQIQKEKHQRL